MLDMDNFFDRLGTLLRSFLDEDSDHLFGSRPSHGHVSDPDLDAAYDELNEFLNSEREQQRKTYTWSDPHEKFGTSNSRSYEAKSQTKPTIPESLRKDFEELGLPFGAGEEECKAAYKRLLKIHHPDRHAGHPGNMKKATEKSSRINAAYQRIEMWRQTGKVE